MDGKLIAFDGNDGSGKFTQAQMLAAYLLRLGKIVLFLSFPRYNDSFFGKMVRRALDGEFGNFVELNPYFASLGYAGDRWQAKELMQRVLDAGGYVICDRYASANQIHQGGKFAIESERVKFLEWLDEMEYLTYGIPHADLSFYLDVPLEVSLRLLRKKSKDTVENNRKYLRNSHRCAQWLIERNSGKWVHVRCADKRDKIRSAKKIHQEVINHLTEHKFF